jgi:hypothetical protein
MIRPDPSNRSDDEYGALLMIIGCLDLGVALYLLVDCALRLKGLPTALLGCVALAVASGAARAANPG